MSSTTAGTYPAESVSSCHPPTPPPSPPPHPAPAVVSAIHGAQLRQPFDFADASSGGDAEEDEDFIRVVEYIERAPLFVCRRGRCAVERDEQRGRWVYVCPSQPVSLHSPRSPQLLLLYKSLSNGNCSCNYISVFLIMY